MPRRTIINTRYGLLAVGEGTAARQAPPSTETQRNWMSKMFRLMFLGRRTTDLVKLSLKRSPIVHTVAVIVIIFDFWFTETDVSILSFWLETCSEARMAFSAPTPN